MLSHFKSILKTYNSTIIHVSNMRALDTWNETRKESSSGIIDLQPRRGLGLDGVITEQSS